MIQLTNWNLPESRVDIRNSWTIYGNWLLEEMVRLRKAGRKAEIRKREDGKIALFVDGTIKRIGNYRYFLYQNEKRCR